MRGQLCVILLAIVFLIITGCIEEHSQLTPINTTEGQGIPAPARPPTLIPAESPIPLPVVTPTTVPSGGILVMNYTLRGQHGTINVPLLQNVYEYQTTLPAVARCYRYLGDNVRCNADETRQYYLTYLNEPVQRTGMTDIINQIKSKTGNSEDQVRIAVSFVQNIPYNSKNNDPYNLQYPYETVYTNAGVCSDKSVLLVYLLRELGYTTTVFSFGAENHAAVGIQTQLNYSYKQTGYAFIETTTPSIITDSYSEYMTIGKLTSTPQVIVLSDGKSFDNLTEDYNDAIRFTQLATTNSTMPPLEYRDWETLVWKYGLRMSDGSMILENPADNPLCDGNQYCNGTCYTECEYGKWICTDQGGICQVS